jgi:nitrogen fixation NifU-like protein
MNQTLLHYYQHCPYFGAWPEDTAHVLTARAGSQSAGEVMQLQVKIEDDTITDVRIQVYGCGYAIAALAYVAEYCVGKKVSALTLTTPEMAKALSIPETKLHSALLAECVLKQLITL